MHAMAHVRAMLCINLGLMIWVACPHQEFELTRGEKLQLANLHPTVPVDMHMVRLCGCCTTSVGMPLGKVGDPTVCLPATPSYCSATMATSCFMVTAMLCAVMQIVSKCEERLTDAQIEQLIAVVQQHLF